MLQYYEVYYFVAVIILKTPCNSLLKYYFGDRYIVYTDNNTVRLEGWYLVMCMVNLLPSLSLKMHSYPECIGGG